MNQTKKRLSIINLAISITDIETIQLQVLKLKLLKIDLRVEEIINLLQSENYAQAQGLITKYIDIPLGNNFNKAIKANKAVVENPIINEDQAIIDEFQLFEAPTRRIQASQRRVEQIAMDEFVKDDIPQKEDNINIDIDNLLKLDIPSTPNIEAKDNFFEKEEKKTPMIDLSLIPKDTFFDTQKEKEQDKLLDIDSTSITPADENINLNNNIKLEDKIEEVEEIDEVNSNNYQPIPDIAQKLLSMRKQYLSGDQSYENYATVEALLTKISKEGYTEEEIADTLFYIKKFAQEDRQSEASQLLLICASTKSKFAHLMLARELYKGLIVKQNIPEAFTIISNLAHINHAEALCDLAQFYENGINVDIDKKKAQELYQESMDMGIHRAELHYKRIKKENRSFFGLF